MRAVRASVIFFACALLAGAQGTPHKEQEKRKPALPPELQAIYGLALAAPPEFAADALLRIAASSDIKDVRAKGDLIDQALQFASRARIPFERVPIGNAAVDTRQGSLASAFQLRLDAVSLQSRAVVGLLAVDKKAAVQAFSAMAHPDIEPLTCADVLVPDLSGYYAALGTVASQALSGDDRVRFLVTAVSRISSHADVSPFARVLKNAGLGGSESQIVLGAFAAKLGSLPSDPRTFGFYRKYIQEDLDNLLSVARQGDSGGDSFYQAAKSYLAAQDSSPACSGPGSVNVNVLLDPKSADASSPKTDPYWQTAPAKKVFEECLALRFRPDMSLIPDAERATPEWGRRLTDFLSTLEGWRPGDEASEADYYHQRAIVYEALIELTPAGSTRDKLLQSYISFLTNSNVQQQSPAEWYWHARSLFDRMRVNGGGAQILAAYRASGSPILVLEAALQSLDPKQFGQ